MASVDNKRGRRTYGLDDVAVVPSRRTRDPEDVSTSWQVDAYHFDIPIFAAPMDSVMSPETAIQLGQFGGLGVLDLEGLWTRYENPTPLLEEIARLDPKDVHHRIREIYSEPIKPGLIRERITQLREAGVVAAGSLSPQRTQEHWKSVVDAGVDIFFIRGTTVSAEHVSGNREPLNLKRFIYELDVPVIVGGCATYTAALHLMRTGAAGVLVGFGGGASQTTWETLGISVSSAASDVYKRQRSHVPPRLPAAAFTGAARHTTPRCRAGTVSRSARSRHSSRSCSAPAFLPMAPRTSSARFATRWRRPATRTSRSSSASRS